MLCATELCISLAQPTSRLHCSRVRGFPAASLSFLCSVQALPVVFHSRIPPPCFSHPPPCTPFRSHDSNWSHCGILGGYNPRLQSLLVLFHLFALHMYLSLDELIALMLFLLCCTLRPVFSAAPPCHLCSVPLCPRPSASPFACALLGRSSVRHAVRLPALPGLFFSTVFLRAASVRRSGPFLCMSSHCVFVFAPVVSLPRGRVSIRCPAALLPSASFPDPSRTRAVPPPPSAHEAPLLDPKWPSVSQQPRVSVPWTHPGPVPRRSRPRPACSPLEPYATETGTRRVTRDVNQPPGEDKSGEANHLTPRSNRSWKGQPLPSLRRSKSWNRPWQWTLAGCCLPREPIPLGLVCNILILVRKMRPGNRVLVGSDIRPREIPKRPREKPFGKGSGGAASFRGATKKIRCRSNRVPKKSLPGTYVRHIATLPGS